MKLTKNQIRNIIMEEIAALESDENLDENWRRRLKNFAIGAGAAIAGLTGLGGKTAKAAPVDPSSYSLSANMNRTPTALPDVDQNQYDGHVEVLDQYGDKTGIKLGFKKTSDKITLFSVDGRVVDVLRKGDKKFNNYEQIGKGLRSFKLEEGKNMKITKSFLKRMIVEELQKEMFGGNVGASPTSGTPKQLNVASGMHMLRTMPDEDAKEKIARSMNEKTLKDFWVGVDPQNPENVVVYGMVGTSAEEAAQILRNSNGKTTYSSMFPDKSTTTPVAEFPKASLGTSVQLGRY